MIQQSCTRIPTYFVREHNPVLILFLKNDRVHHAARQGGKKYTLLYDSNQTQKQHHKVKQNQLKNYINLPQPFKNYYY